MRKILSALILLSILAFAVVPLVASAQTGPQECCKIKKTLTVGDKTCTPPAENVVGPSLTATCDFGAPTCLSERWGIFCALSTLNTIIDWIFTVMVILAVLFSILGAFNLLTGAGSPEKVTSGRNYILYAAIGLVVALISRAIPGIVKAVMGY
ncbi:MAG: pilin [Candidatus Wildermuthbacteria bacterium]|nr:pilin [Candidatus Wildermuthbacteria bacterium]